ncbi:hypothetical protein HanIR_Chr10g0478721 [Helianthus annuus]|nr:hypothetical protein HanIR_Chr10g0478721 [Helianthus annuus]
MKFQVPELNSKWKRRLFVILHDKLKIPDFREIPGTFNAERVDRDIRAGVHYCLKMKRVFFHMIYVLRYQFIQYSFHTAKKIQSFT